MTKRQIHEAYPDMTKENALHIWNFPLFDDEKIDIRLSYESYGFDTPWESIRLEQKGMSAHTNNGNSLYQAFKEKYGEPTEEATDIGGKKTALWLKDGYQIKFRIEAVNNPNWEVEFLPRSNVKAF